MPTSGIEENPRDASTFDLYAYEEEVKPIPDGEFEFVQLEDNHVWSVNIRFGLSLGVRSTLHYLTD